MTSRKGSKYVSGSTDAQSACVTRYSCKSVFPQCRWHVHWCVENVMCNQWLSHLTAFHGEGQAGDCMCCQHPAGE